MIIKRDDHTRHPRCYTQSHELLCERNLRTGMIGHRPSLETTRGASTRAPIRMFTTDPCDFWRRLRRIYSSLDTPRTHEAVRYVWSEPLRNALLRVRLRYLPNLRAFMRGNSRIAQPLAQCATSGPNGHAERRTPVRNVPQRRSTHPPFFRLRGHPRSLSASRVPRYPVTDAYKSSRTLETSW